MRARAHAQRRLQRVQTPPPAGVAGWHGHRKIKNRKKVVTGPERPARAGRAPKLVFLRGFVDWPDSAVCYFGLGGARSSAPSAAAPAQAVAKAQAFFGELVGDVSNAEILLVEQLIIQCRTMATQRSQSTEVQHRQGIPTTLICSNKTWCVFIGEQADVLAARKRGRAGATVCAGGMLPDASVCV